MSRATSGGTYATVIEQPAVWQRTHAVLASPLAISSMTSVKVTGSSSPPSKLRGNKSRKNPASCSASTRGSGIRRSRSI